MEETLETEKAAPKKQIPAALLQEHAALESAVINLEEIIPHIRNNSKRRRHKQTLMRSKIALALAKAKLRKYG